MSSIPPGSLWIVMPFTIDAIFDCPVVGVQGFSRPVDHATAAAEEGIQIYTFDPGTVLLAVGRNPGRDNPYHTYAHVVIPHDCYINTTHFLNAKRVKRLA